MDQDEGSELEAYSDTGEIELEPRKLDVYAQGAAFYVACLKSGFSDEADEFAEWFLDTFDLDLEE